MTTAYDPVTPKQFDPPRRATLDGKTPVYVWEYRPDGSRTEFFADCLLSLTLDGERTRYPAQRVQFSR